MDKNQKELLEADECPEFLELFLYIAGRTPKSRLAFANLKELCKTDLHGRCHIHVVDVVEHPEVAKDEDITAIPTLIRISPDFSRRVVGTLEDSDKVILGLDLSIC